MILRARWVVDRSLCLHEHAWVDTATNRVGQRTPGRKPVVDLGDSILMPGLVNAHCHLDYTDFRGRIPAQKSFVDWILRIVRLKKSWTRRQFTRSIQHGLDEALGFGTTAMANWICSPGTMKGLRPRPMRITWLWEQIAYRGEDVFDAWKVWPAHCARFSPLWLAGIAPHAPYTCSRDIIRQAEEWSARRRRPWSMHVAESRDEDAMFRRECGPMFRLFEQGGRDMRDCGNSSPFQFLQSQPLHRTAPLLLVHANHIGPGDFRFLKPPVSIVHCPRAHAYFRHRRFPLEQLRARGVNICLGTDSLASNEDLSMFGEMRRCASVYPRMAPREIVRMATLNGARALGMGSGWRSWRDWVAISCRGRRDAWNQITSFTGRPHFVMVNGEVVPCPK